MAFVVHILGDIYNRTEDVLLYKRNTNNVTEISCKIKEFHINERYTFFLFVRVRACVRAHANYIQQTKRSYSVQTNVSVCLFFTFR